MLNANLLARDFTDKQGVLKVMTGEPVPMYQLSGNVISATIDLQPEASQNRKPPHLVWAPSWSRGPLRISPSNFPRWKVRLYATFMWKTRDPNFSGLVTVRSRHRQTDRQTTYHENSRTLQWNCNVRLKSDKNPMNLVCAASCIALFSRELSVSDGTAPVVSILYTVKPTNFKK